jgi:aminoglycoside 3-N-acetyltransferase
MSQLKVRILALLKRFAPFVIDWGRAFKKRLKRNQLEKKKRENALTAEQLLSDLNRMGIKKGDNLMVHSSLSRIGYVEGGAETVIDVLLEAIGEEGTLMMPAFAHQTFSKYYLDGDPVFDVRNSPSKAGAITEAFRLRPGVQRSLHPTDSVCAFGPLAAYFTGTHFAQLTPYNKHSPYYKLALKKGKILNMGVTFNTGCTNLHTLEDAVDFKFPVYHEKVYEVKMIDSGGQSCSMKTKVHDPAYSVKRRPDELIPVFEKEGVVKRYPFGEAEVLLVDAEGLFEAMIRLYGSRGVTMYTPQGS